MSLARGLERTEERLLIAALVLLALLPLADALGRPLGGLHVPGAASYVQQLTLWLAFLGGLLATREGKHLTLSTADLFGERVRAAGRLLAAALSAGTEAVLTYACIGLLAWLNTGGCRRLCGGWRPMSSPRNTAKDRRRT